MNPTDETPKELTPSEYFAAVKARKQEASDAYLDQVYANALTLLNKYQVTGQRSAMRKLLFQLDMIAKEREVIQAGVTTFVYRTDVERYIDEVAHDVVKVQALAEYEREIPDAITETVARVKDCFTDFYVVFTDYQKVTEKQVEQARRDRDPILFGAFRDHQTGTTLERFYVIGDWVDPYCDLTLERMVAESTAKFGTQIAQTIATPEDLDALKQQLRGLQGGGWIRSDSEAGPVTRFEAVDQVSSALSTEFYGYRQAEAPKPSQGWFQRVKSWLGR